MSSSLAVCESAIVLDTAADLTPWSWYARAYQRYCTSIFLLLEVHRNPKMPRIERITAVLDHVYGPPSVSSCKRNNQILKALASNLHGFLQNCNMKPMELPTPHFLKSQWTGSFPDLGITEQTGSTNRHQGGMGYDHAYGQDIIPNAPEDWYYYPAPYPPPADDTVKAHSTSDTCMNAGMDWSA